MYCFYTIRSLISSTLEINFKPKNRLIYFFELLCNYIKSDGLSIVSEITSFKNIIGYLTGDRGGTFQKLSFFLQNEKMAHSALLWNIFSPSNQMISVLLLNKTNSQQAVWFLDKKSVKRISPSFLIYYYTFRIYLNQTLEINFTSIPRRW